MKNRIFFFLIHTIVILAFSLSQISGKAQSTIKIAGKVFDRDNKTLPLSQTMIINKRTNNGTFADAEGKFSLTILPSDTIIFSAIGFRVKSLCFKDSVASGIIYFDIALHKLQFELKEVSVFANRSLNEIQNDIDKLGVRKTYSAEGINSFESPITALYERFSKFAKSKQRVAEWENEDLKRDILKDLFHLYVKYEVIDLKDDEFDAFVKYLNLSDAFIQNASQFELVMAIKGKYESFKYRWK
jgi:hypothetical protein